MRAFASQCVSLVRAWWRGDRIRVSPREGRLLAIAVGSAIRVGSVYAEVTSRRRIDTAAAGPVAEYGLRTDDGPARLRVPLAGCGALVFARDGIDEVVSDDDVWLVFAPSPSGRGLG